MSELTPAPKEATYNIRLQLNSLASIAQCQELLDLISSHKMVKEAEFILGIKK